MRSALPRVMRAGRPVFVGKSAAVISDRSQARLRREPADSSSQRVEILAADDPPTAYQLLADAETMMERIDPAELVESTYWYTPAFFRGTHAFVLDKLGERDRARELMAQSLNALPDEWARSEWAERRRAFVAA